MDGCKVYFENGWIIVRSALDYMRQHCTEHISLTDVADPSMRVHAMAEQVGYNDVAHFSKSFKKIVGKTPGEYRASIGK